MSKHENYVSLEVAKLLKQVGFDWGCPTAWDLTFPNEPYLNYDAIYPVDFRNNLDDVFYAPTLAVAQKWLREVKNIEICIHWEIEFEEKELDWNKRRYCYDIDTHVDDIPLLSIDDDYWAEGYHTFGNSYSTYEEAQEAGIKKALEMILEKGEYDRR